MSASLTASLKESYQNDRRTGSFSAVRYHTSAACKQPLTSMAASPAPPASGPRKTADNIDKLLRSLQHNARQISV
jgi:hypothetical protein